MAEHEYCSNCRRDIPTQNYRMHSLHCARNIALCPDCDEPIPRGELEEHKAECAGRLVECPMMCGEKVEAGKLDDHKANICPKRTTLCKFCATHVEMGNLTEHENYCGSRTEKCEKCGEFIMLKNFDLHIESCHGFIKIKDEPGPTPSWEKKTAVKSNTANYSSYSSQAKSTVSDPTPSTPAQRSNFTATELFNNQDLYSSRRYSATNGLSSSASSSTLSSVNRSGSSSIVASVLNKSTSSSNFAETRRSSIRESASTTSNVSKSSTVSSALDKHSTSIANAHVNGQLNGGGSNDVMLPCEFCEKMIPMYKLLSHQAECVNPSNVRGSSSSTSYSRYSSSSAVRGTSVSRSDSLNGGPSSSRVNKYLRQDSTPTESETPPTTGSGSTSRKISPKANSIVNRYITSPEPKTNGYESQTKKYLPDSPPSYEKQEYASASYTGRSSYLREEARKEESRRDSLTRSASKSQIKTTKTQAPGMYDNDDDREGLRQMLSSMRRDPMDVEDDPDNNDGSFFPCEFCGDPYPCEFLMRHQMSCDLNPQPVSSGAGFDYNSIKRSIGRNLGLPESEANNRPKQDAAPTSSNVTNLEPEAIARESRRLSRSNSVIERSYSRSNIRASSVSRTSSFADRSYGTRTSLGRQSSFSIADYSSAVRRSSVFDGYAGYSIYSSISEGLDSITHGGRTSRRNSVTESTNYSLSRRGSFSTRNDHALPALMASLEATKASKSDERDITDGRREKPTATAIANAHINSQAKALQNGHHNHMNGYSRQHSQSDSTKTVDSPFGATNGHHAPNEIQKSESKVLRRRSSLKHSESGYKLKKEVSFHKHDQIIIDGKGVAVDENGVALPNQPTGEKKKKKRTEEEKQARREKKERKEARRQERAMSKDRKCKTEEPKIKQHPVGGELFEQVSAKLHDIERERNSSDSMPTTPLAPVPSTSLFPDFSSSSHQASTKSNTASVANPGTEPAHIKTANTVPGHVDVGGPDNKLTLNSEPVCRAKSSKGPAPQPPIVDNLVNLEDQSVVLREHHSNESEDRTRSNRNSLDNKSVQTLAKDLAAECAKAYELMESSLSKLTNDFSIGPFGLTPKTKKKYRGPPAPPLK